MGCGCKCGHCPNAFEPRQLDVGGGAFAQPLATRYEQEESELERGMHRGFARRSPGARPQAKGRMMASASSVHGPAGHAHQARRQGMGHASKARASTPAECVRPRRRSGTPAAPARHAGRTGAVGSVAMSHHSAVCGAALSPNAVMLNRRLANQLGWRTYYNPILTLLGPAAIGGELAFAQAVAEWQAAKGLPSNGVLGATSWNQMQADLASSPDAAPPTGLTPPPAPMPLGMDADAPLGETEWESESARTVARQVSRRWANCSPPADTPPTERTVLSVVSRLETGRPFACTVSANDGISMGIVRWNLRDGTLQRLLARFENRTGRLIRFFGPDYDRLMGLIALRQSPAQRNRAVAAAAAERLADRWRGRLLSLFSDATFDSMIMQDVRGQLAASKGAARRLGLWTVRGLTLMFDIAAREGLSPAKLERFAARLRHFEGTKGALSEQEKLVAIADESVRRLGRHRDERRARRMVIATGSGPARGRWLDLGRDYANLDAPWES